MPPSRTSPYKSIVSTATRGRIAVASLFMSLFVLYITFWYPEFASQPESSDDNDGPKVSGSKFGQFRSQDNLHDIYNSTIGFQAVYAINLPERTDKQDSILLQSRLTDIDVRMMHGVIGANVPAKAIPHTFDQDNGTIGAWRAHLNVMDYMIQNNIQTAMVFEDDADWDIGLKAQLTEFARGSRFLLGSEDKVPNSPYGDGWDILWIGHCASKPNGTDNRRWVVPHDPTVCPAGSRWAFEGPDMTRWEEGPNPDPQTRIVYVQQYAWCIAGYAISLRGAERVLYSESLVPYNSPVDEGMGILCSREMFDDFTCIAPFPRIVGVSKSAGSTNRGSDIGHVPAVEKIWETSRSENVMFSVRQNIVRLLRGETTFQSYFENPSGDFLTLEQITSARGHPEWLNSEAGDNKHGDQLSARDTTRTRKWRPLWLKRSVEAI